MGFSPGKIHNYCRDSDLQSNAVQVNSLRHSGCFQLIPVATGCGGNQPGQNRDKFPVGPTNRCRLAGIFFLALAAVVASASDDPLPRPNRRKNRPKSERGLPSDAELYELAQAYLIHQRQHWPDLARSGYLVEPTSEVLLAMVEDFKERHRAGKAFIVMPCESIEKWGGAYARFSCDNSDPTSIIDQVTRCLARARSDGNFIPWQYVFGDYSISGLSSSRQGYSSYKAILETDSRLSITYIDDFSRASRAEIEWWFLGSLCKKLGKGLIGASDGFDLSNPNSDILITVFGLVSRLFIRGLKEKVMRGMKGTVERGGSLGRLPLGFTRKPKHDRNGDVMLRTDGRQRYERSIDPATRENALSIFEMFVYESLTRSRITKIFNQRSVDGWNGWTHGAITKLLENPLFMGVVIWNQRRREFDPETMEWTTVKNPVSEWEYSYEPGLAIVPEDLWFAARAKLAELVSENKNTGRSFGRCKVTPTTLFSGTLECESCKRELTLIRSTEKYKQMGCTNGGNHRHDCKLTTSKSTRTIEACLLKYLNDAILSDQAVEELVVKANAYVAQEAARSTPDTAKKEKEAKKLRGKISKLIGMVGNEENANLCKAYHQQARKLQGELDALQAELRLAEQSEVVATTPLDEGRLRSLLADMRALLGRDVPAAAAAIRQLTGPISIRQEPIAGRKNGARWIATFSPSLVRLLVHLAKRNNYPECVTLEYLKNKEWIIPVPVEVPIEYVPQYKVLAEEFLELNERGVSIYTIGHAHGMSGTQAAGILRFARTGERPPSGSKPRSPGPPKEPKQEPLYKQLSAEVADLRDKKQLGWSEIREALAEKYDGRRFPDATLRRAYDTARPELGDRRIRQGKMAPRHG